MLMIFIVLQAGVILASQLSVLSNPITSDCPTQTDGCIVTDNEDNILTVTQAGSTAECSQMCLDFPTCDYFTYRTDLQLNCFLLSSCDELDETCTTCQSGAVRCQQNCPPGTDHQISHGIFRCNNKKKSCLLDCDYGYITKGLHRQTCTSLSQEACVPPMAFLAGGYNKPRMGDTTFLETAEIFSMERPEECQVDIGALSFARKGMIGGWVDSKIIACGGQSIDDQVHQDCWSYEVVSNKWRFYANLTVERTKAAATVYGGCLVVTGGVSGSGKALDSVEVVGGEGCIWNNQEMALPVGMEGHCVAIIGREMYFVGGGPSSYGSARVYNLEDGLWKNITSPLKDRYGHDCTKEILSNGEEGLVVAGNDFSPADFAEFYQPSTDSWEWTGWMKNERDGGSMAVMGGHPTIFGGYGGDYCCKEYYNTAEQYNSITDRWLILNHRNMTTGRKNHATFAIPSTIFPHC